MVLLDRLNNDRSLARFAGQFVPLKIISSNKEPDWRTWSSKYHVDEGGIPQLYVIRSDGKKLYSGVGSLPGEELPTMLVAALNRAGRNFSDSEAQVLADAVTKSQAALDTGDLLASAHALTPILRFGSPDELGSFAKSAIDAKELYSEIQSATKSSISKARSELASTDDNAAFDAVLEIAQAKVIYRLFPKLKTKANSVSRDLKKDPDQTTRLTQAEGLIKARSLRASPTETIRKRANKAYVAVIRRFPATRADELARIELAQIDPDAKILNSTAAMHDYREWTSRSGKFTMTAKYVGKSGIKIELRKKSGKTILIDPKMLSEEDHEYLEKFGKTTVAGE